MKRLVFLVIAILMTTTTLLLLPTVAQSDTRVTGGGTGTFGDDLDGDGDIDGSQFGMGVPSMEITLPRGTFCV
jgi:hypothetical protein